MAVSMATKPLLPGQHAPTWWAYLLCAGLCLPFAFHRRRPVVALAAQCVVLLAYAPGAWPASPACPVFALVAGVALHCDRRRALLAAAASAGSSWSPSGCSPRASRILHDRRHPARRGRLLAVGGEPARAPRPDRRPRGRARLAEAEREDRARLAVAEERMRIARELHDVVAHAMSVVVVQSGVAHHVIDTRPEAARQALSAIETTSRDALVEMRLLLGVLRGPGDDGREASPGAWTAPGFAGLEGLAGHVRAAGLDVTLDLPDPWPAAPAGVQLTVHRLCRRD